MLNKRLRASSTYAADGTVASTSDELGLTTSYGYDADGRQTSVTQENVPVWNAATGANVATNLTTSYSYDADGRQIAVIDPLGHETDQQYDSGGRVIKTVFDDFSFITVGYDAARIFVGAWRSDSDKWICVRR